MHRIDLRKVDLNLLKAFVAIERSRSITKSADQLGIGQPAMSHALSRLREMMRDELFVRGPGGMAPTLHALELIGPIRAALVQIESALGGRQEFDPANSDKRYLIGMSDFVAAAVLPALSKALATAAPGASVAVLNADRSNAARLIDSQEIDLAVGLFPEAATWHRKARLFEEGHVCVYNPRLLKVRAPVTLKDYLSHPHVLVTLRADERGFVDDILAKSKLKRKIAITTPYFLLAGYLLHQLPLMASLPRRYAELCTVTSKLAIGPLPFTTPTFTVSMMWHARDETNPAQVFLRRLISKTVGSSS